jgi:HAD superfamily hydrolase (TIGR01509 family)
MRESNKKRGVLFDLDGVISDTQDMHSQVESEFLRSLDIHIHPDEITARFAGVGDKQMFATVLSEYGMNHPVEEISKEKWKIMSAMVAKHGIKPVPYALELIDNLYKNDFVLAIASGSPLIFIEQVIEALSIRKYFAAYVSAEEVERGKPAPDVFLEAAKRSSIDANECVIIEDGLSGMQAAATAKIPCIGLVKDKSKTYPATLLVSSLKDVTIELIATMANKEVSVI